MEIFLTVIEVASYVIAGASVVAAATPTKKDDEIVSKIKSFINVFALNIGGAKPGP